MKVGARVVRVSLMESSNKDCSMLGSVLGSLCFGDLPCLVKCSHWTSQKPVCWTIQGT